MRENPTKIFHFVSRYKIILNIVFAGQADPNLKRRSIFTAHRQLQQKPANWRRIFTLNYHCQDQVHIAPSLSQPEPCRLMWMRYQTKYCLIMYPTNHQNRCIHLKVGRCTSISTYKRAAWNTYLDRFGPLDTDDVRKPSVFCTSQIIRKVDPNVIGIFVAYSSKEKTLSQKYEMEHIECQVESGKSLW